jgi:adenine-specific DNA-methyltransferase
MRGDTGSGSTRGDGVPAVKRFFSEVRRRVPQTIWLNSETGYTQEARKKSRTVPGREPFATPSPERLIRQVVELGSGPNEIVLDVSFGPGTTAAVAHKLGRRWVGVERRRTP